MTRREPDNRAPRRRARRRLRRSRRSPSTRSSRTATPAPSSRPTARSTGSACRASTRRASSAACSTAQAGFFRFAPFGINHPTARRLRARDERARDDLEDAERLDRRPRRADDGAARRTRTRSRPTRGPRPTTTPTTCSCGRSSASRAASRSSSSASPPSTTAVTPATWALVGDDRHAADATGAGQTIRLADRSRARHRGEPRSCQARSRRRRPGLLRPLLGRGPRRPAGRRRGQGADRRDDALLAGAGSAEPASRTTASATRFSARR